MTTAPPLRKKSLDHAHASAMAQVQLLHLNVHLLTFFLTTLHPCINHLETPVVDIPQPMAMQMHRAVRLHMVQNAREFRDRKKSSHP